MIKKEELNIYKICYKIILIYINLIYIYIYIYILFYFLYLFYKLNIIKT